MIYSMNSHNIKSFSELQLDGKVKHSMNMCFSVYLKENIEYRINDNYNSGGQSNGYYVIKNDNINVIYNGRFECPESGIYTIYSMFLNGIKGMKTTSISPQPDSFNEKNVQDFHKLNSQFLGDFCGTSDILDFDNPGEIELVNGTDYYVNSANTSDFRYPIYNVVNDNSDGYAIFDRIYQSYADRDSQRELAAINFSFPDKENIRYMMIDFAMEDMEMEVFHFYFNLYGSNYSGKWVLLKRIYPDFIDSINWEYIESESEQNSLYVVDNSLSNPSEQSICNLPCPRYLLDFENTDYYKNYRLELSSIRSNDNIGYIDSKSVQFKVNQIRCFSKNFENYPIARFPLQENCMEQNNWVNQENLSVAFQKVDEKKCAYFSELIYSQIFLPRLFFSNMRAFTISLFVFVRNSDMENGSEKGILSKGYGFGYEIKLVRGNTNGDIQQENTKTQVIAGLYTDRFENICEFSISDESFYDLWHQIAVTFDGTAFCLYFDGDLKDRIYTSGNVDYSIKSSQNNKQIYFEKMLIGGMVNDNGGISNFFQGYIREITFYKKALLNNQIRQIYTKEI